MLYHYVSLKMSKYIVTNNLYEITEFQNASCNYKGIVHQ